MLTGVWIAAYISNEIRDDILWLQAASRFLQLMTVCMILFCAASYALDYSSTYREFADIYHYNSQASILVLALFSISISQPLLSQISLRRRDPLEFETMGQALGIPDSGLLLQKEPAIAIDPSEPLDKLLLNKRFRHSFMAFADRCVLPP